MSDQNNQPDNQQDIYEMSDSFIEMANAMLSEKRDLGRVSAAFRYAASRFNAFEATAGATEITGDPAETVTWFTEQYKTMLKGNLDELIAQINGTCPKE